MLIDNENNEKENPRITLLFFGLFFGSIAIGMCGIMLWDNPTIMISGFMSSLAVMSIAAICFFWHRDQVKANAKEYKIVWPYIVFSFILFSLLVLVVISFWLDITALTIASAFGFVFTSFLAVFIRNYLIVKISMRRVTADPMATKQQGEIISVHEYSINYRNHSSTQVVTYKVIIKVNHVKSISFVNCKTFKWNSFDKKVKESLAQGNTVDILFNEAKPKYCVILFNNES